MPTRLLLALLGGLGLWAAFPSAGVWPLASLGVAALALATAGARPGQAAVLGFAFGMASFGPMLSWSGVYLGPVPWLALAVLQSLYTAGMGAICGWLQPARDLSNSAAGNGHPFWREVGRLRVRPVVVALAWVSQEFARSHTPFGGFPWGRLAFSQADAPGVRYAALAGAPGLSAAVALTGGCLAAGLLALARHRLGPGLAWVAGGLALTVGPLLLPVPTDGPTATVLAVQGNVPQAGLDFNAQRRAVLDNHADLTARAGELIRSGQLPRPDLVVWPENASDIDPYRNADAERVITGAVAAVDTPVLLGAVLEEPADHNTNSSLLYTPSAGLVDRYDKRHPVPFAEYIPWRPFFRFFSTQVDLVERDFVAGSRVGVMTVPRPQEPPLVAGVSICFEVAGDDLVTDGVNAGANLLVVQTNNATFGFTDEAAQQLAISRVRAVEHARSVVHISNVGISALIRPDGAAPETTSLFTAATLTASLPLRSQLTPAARLGSWPALLAVVGLVGVGLQRLVADRHRGASSGLSLPGAGSSRQYSEVSVSARPSSTGDPRPSTARRKDRAPLMPSDPDVVPSPTGPVVGAGPDLAVHATPAPSTPPRGGRAPLNRVLVLIPTYNERDTLPDVVRRVRAATPAADLLVIDDDSPDGTGQAADEMAAHDARVWVLHRAGKEGLGKAYLDGFRWGLDRGYDALVEMDADGSHRPEDLPSLLAAAEDADVVIGSRWVPGGEVVNWPVHRKALSLGGNLYIRVALGMRVRDATAGFRVYRATALEKLDLGAVESHGYCFQVDLTWKAVRAGLTVVEVPISFVERQVGDSKMSGSIIAESMLNVTGWGLRHRVGAVRSRWQARSRWHRLDG